MTKFSALLIFCSFLASNAQTVGINVAGSFEVKKVVDAKQLDETELNVYEPNYAEICRSYQSAANISENAQPNYNFDSVFFLQMKVGTPGKKFNLLLETGVTTAFLFLPEYKDHRKINKYHPENSSTSNPYMGKFSAKTGGIEVSGKYFSDVFQIKKKDIDGEFRQIFGAVDEMEFRSDFPADGVFGMGWDPRAPKAPVPDTAPIHSLLHAHSQYKTFTLRLGRKKRHRKIVWGTVDAIPYPIHSLHGLPAITVERFKFNKYHSEIPLDAVVDSGYSVILLPKEHYRVVVNHLHPKFDRQSGLYFVQCHEKAPSLAFGLGAVDWHIRSREYILTRNTPHSQCVLAVGQSLEQHYVLGLSFMKSLAVVFDTENDTIGFGSPYRD